MQANEDALLGMQGAKRHLEIFAIQILLVILAFQMHEGGHYLMGKLCGLEVEFAYTHVRVMSKEVSFGQRFWFGAGGPLVTHFCAMASLLAVILKVRPTFFLLFGISNAFLRAVVMFISLVRSQSHQDEHRLAQLLSWPETSLVWVSGLLAFFILGAFIVLTRRNRFRVLAICIAAGIIAPQIVYWARPHLP